MTTARAGETDGDSGMLTDFEDVLGFLSLGLAQMISIFAIWFAVWPGLLDIPSPFGRLLGLAFFAAGGAGFYFAFEVLSV